jgi:hypothetical protein
MTALAGVALAMSPLRAQSSDEDLLRANKVGSDGPALLAFFRQRTLSEDDCRKIEALVQRLGARSFAQREQATQALLKWGAPAQSFLRAALADRDIEVARRAERCLSELAQGPGPALPCAAARVLARKAPREAITTLVAYVPFAAEEGVQEAVFEALIVLAPPDRKPDDALRAALKDAGPLRRAAGAHVLGRHSDPAIRASVRRLLEDKDVRVRFHAAQGLVFGRDRAALPVLVALLAELPLGQAWQAEELLFRVAGEQAPGVSLGDGSAEARKKCRTAWEGWHTRHGASSDLTRLQGGQHLLGLTIGIEYNTSRVWECGPDGTTRWEMGAAQGISGPMDAWALPGNRVLIADNHGVCERDFKGNVLWKLEGVAGPNGCQRLPNGHTFVSSYNSVMEFDRDGKRIWQHNIPGSNAIRKHRNGHIVYAQNNAIVEIDVEAKAVRKVPLPQGFWVGIEDLAGDRFLMADSGKGRIVEVDATGKVLWEAHVAGACGVTRLPNGHTLVATNGQVVELDRGGKAIWERKVPGYARRVHRR